MLYVGLRDISTGLKSSIVHEREQTSFGLPSLHRENTASMVPYDIMY